MKFKSPVYSQVSGSVAGLTYAHNRGGLYVRARATPTNPNTVQQQEVRSIMSQLTNLWLNVLTAAQRGGWDAYATLVLVPDRLGEPRNIGGLGHYVRSNSPRLQIGLARVDDAPQTFNLGDYTEPTMAAPSEATQQFPLAFEATDAWVSEDGAAMAFWTSRPQNPSVNYFKGPYRHSVAIAGDSGAPPASPQQINSAFAFTAGQRLFIRVNVTRADGRLGTESRQFFLAGA